MALLRAGRGGRTSRRFVSLLVGGWCSHRRGDRPGVVLVASSPDCSSDRPALSPRLSASPSRARHRPGIEFYRDRLGRCRSEAGLVGAESSAGRQDRGASRRSPDARAWSGAHTGITLHVPECSTNAAGQRAGVRFVTEPTRDLGHHGDGGGSRRQRDRAVGGQLPETTEHGRVTPRRTTEHRSGRRRVYPRPDRQARSLAAEKARPPARRGRAERVLDNLPLLLHT